MPRQNRNAALIPRGYGTGWISESWALFRLAPWTWILVGFVTLATQLAVNSVIEMAYEGPVKSITNIMVGKPHPGDTFHWWWVPVIAAGMMVESLVSSYFLLGQLRLGLQAMRRETLNIGSAFSAWSRALSLFGYGLLTFLTMLPCWVPFGFAIYKTMHAKELADPTYVLSGLGIWAVSSLIWLVFFVLTLPGMALVADGMAVLEAFTTSIRTSFRHFGALYGSLTVVSLLWIGAVATLFLGWFVLYPMWWIMMALMARDIVGIASGTAPATEPDLSAYGAGSGDGIWPPPPSQHGGDQD